MARGRQVVRLLNLTRLVTQPGGVAVSAAIRQLRCTRRTLYRDLDLLQQLGYPLHSEQDGDGITRWRVVDGFRPLHQLVVSHEELVALWMGRGALAGLDGTPFGNGAQSLLEKLEAAVPAPVRERLEQSRRVIAPSGVTSRYATHAAALQVVQHAAEERRTVRMTYRSLDGRRGLRLVDPYVLWFDPARGGLYFAGWTHDRRAVRTFLLDRVSATSMTDAHFVVSPGWDAQRELAEAFVGFQGRPQAVRLRFRGRAARLLSERPWHPSQTVRDLGGGEIEVRMRVPTSPGLTAWVLSWLPEVVVVEPAALVRAVDDAARAALERPGPRRRGVVGVSRGVTRRGYGEA